MLTLALGIGGTTAIFTLVHAVMLRSLPVTDPGSLYRVGEGDDCCVQGGAQDRWGMFSYPLFERLKAETPEFEEVTAFQAGRWRLSVRREGVEAAARPLRSEYVTEIISQRWAWARSADGYLPQMTTNRPLRRLLCSATRCGRPPMAPTLR